MPPLAPDPLLAIILRRYEEGWNRGNLAVLDELLAPDFRAHDSAAPGGVVDCAGLRALLLRVRAEFPDLHREVLDAVAHGEKIAVLWRVTGTLHGARAGASPTESLLVATGITLYHILDSHIREEWVAMDSAGLARRLAAI